MIAAGSALTSLAERIRRERILHGVTQKEMAIKVGLSRKAYLEFEKTGRGSTKTLVNTLFALGRQKELLDLIADQRDAESLEAFRRDQGPRRVRVRGSTGGVR